MKNQRRSADAAEEDRVADDAEPAERLERGELEEVGAAGVPEAVLDARPGLREADRQEAQDDHQREADVHPPERPLQLRLLPRADARELPRDDEDEAEREEAVDAEERGVGVDGRRVEALHVVEGDRRVDEEAEDARADEVPEGDADEEADRPAVALHPRGARCCRRLVWSASMPMSISGTTSSALKLAPTAMIEIGVPLK